MKKDFDEINTIKGIDYNTYFGEMDISEEEKKRRISIAEDLEVALLLFFLLFLEGSDMDYEDMISSKYTEIAKKHLGFRETPVYISDHARQFAEGMVTTTQNHPGSEYYTSQDRAMVNAADEANTLGNYKQQADAIKAGKKNKSWRSMRDDRTRETHLEADGQTVGIFEPFHVGDSYLMFPRDISLGAEVKEVAGCRCIAEYS